MTSELTIIFIVLVILTTILILVLNNWKWKVGLLAVQYLGVFYLTTLSWPINLAITKLVAGWIAGALLGLAIYSLPSEMNESNAHPEGSSGAADRLSQNNKPTGSRPFFYILSSLLVILLVFSTGPSIVEFIPEISLGQIFGSMILISMGILQLGFTSKPLATIIGLLTFLGGFEILYSALETSALVAGLLATLTLGLATIGSYLILSPTMERAE